MVNSTKSKPRGTALWMAAALGIFGAWFFLADVLLPTPEDLRSFHVWMTLAHEKGVLHVYEWTDAEVASRFLTKNVEYPPLVFLHYFLARLLPAAYWSEPWPSFTVKALFRVTSLAAQFLLLLALFKPYADRTSQAPQRFFLFFVVNPALYLLGMTLGQYDILMGLLMYLSLDRLLEDRPVPSALAAAAAFLLKPTGLLLFPLIALTLFRTRKGLLIWAGTFAGAVLAFTLPWTLTSGDLWLTQGFRLAVDPKYLQASPAAYNVWWAAGRLLGFVEFSSAHKAVGVGLAALALLFPLRRALGEKDVRKAVLGFATAYFIAYVLFTTNVTGKHLAYAMLFASFLALEQDAMLLPALTLIPLSAAAITMNGANGNGRLAPFLSGLWGLSIGWLVFLGTLIVFSQSAGLYFRLSQTAKASRKRSKR